jgi:uncharacterized protein with ACT and thioredoxin-like domain
MSDAKSVRVQLREDTQKRLKEIALQLNCTYGSEPSITALLSNIASGQLQLTSLTSIQKQKSRGLIIQLSIILPFYFSGIIYLISDNIAESGGNIQELSTHEFMNSGINQKGILNILVEVDDLECLKNLLKNLNEITLSSLKKFNKNKEEQIDILENQFAREIKQSNLFMMDAIDGCPELNLSNFKPKAKLIIDIRCTLGIGIRVENKKGVAADITEKIASKNILISYMSVKRDAKNKNISYIEIYLFFQPLSSIESKNGIKNIYEVKKSIEEVPGFLQIEDLDMMVLQLPLSLK